MRISLKILPQIIAVTAGALLIGSSLYHSQTKKAPGASLEDYFDNAFVPTSTSRIAQRNPHGTGAGLERFIQNLDL